jgi:4-hydroxy-tetrahydrodipicolinate reductase
MLNLALIGYGKMGHMVESLAIDRGHRVIFKVDVEGNERGQALTNENLQGVDVAINFSTPESVLPTVERLAALGVNMVIGTTGWMDRLAEVRGIVEKNGVGLVYGSNFSIGVNIFFRLMEAAAAMLQKFPEYEPWIYEIHHSAKLDAPSGTALKLKEILEKSKGGSAIVPASNRVGKHPGTHTVGFDSEADTLTFTHTARSRQGFAGGALRAAEWVRGKKGLYEFSETLSS